MRAAFAGLCKLFFAEVVAAAAPAVLRAAVAVLEIGRLAGTVAAALAAILRAGIAVFLDECHAVAVATKWRDDGAFAGAGAALELSACAT